MKAVNDLVCGVVKTRGNSPRCPPEIPKKATRYEEVIQNDERLSQIIFQSKSTPLGTFKAILQKLIPFAASSSNNQLQLKHKAHFLMSDSSQGKEDAKCPVQYKTHKVVGRHTTDINGKITIMKLELIKERKNKTKSHSLRNVLEIDYKGILHEEEKHENKLKKSFAKRLSNEGSSSSSGVGKHLRLHGVKGESRIELKGCLL
eukprot:TRINITY_DN11061_c0_g2_i2.p1 TRINITY_DN11061_c0_g2~~TRINITY_DN11061_c0_g2_i2.p1  ORF type:complete len:203 (-),score=45.06 TRINITY_DN11061_c0_g2_i2:42-650(-)